MTRLDQLQRQAVAHEKEGSRRMLFAVDKGTKWKPRGKYMSLGVSGLGLVRIVSPMLTQPGWWMVEVKVEQVWKAARRAAGWWR